MTQLIYKYNNVEDLTPISSTTNNVTQTNWSNLIMPQGIYSYNGINYNFNTDGLINFINVNVDGGYRIIYNNDVPALLSAIAWLCTYGHMDESLTNAQMATKAKTCKLSLRCGATIAFAQYLLNSVGIVSRVCNLLTATTPNNFDDGHVALEVNIGENWFFWDIANNFYPSLSGIDLTLDNYINNMSAEKIFIADGERDLLGAGSYQFDTNVFYDIKLRTPNNLNDWISRIYQIPGITYTDGKTYFYMPSGTASRQSWVLSLSTNYVVVSYATWISMFY